MSASDKPCTPVRYEQSPGAQPSSPNKKRRKTQRSNSTAQGAQSASAQAPDAMPPTPSGAGSMKMMDSDAAVATATAAAVGAGGMMPLQRSPYDADIGSMRAMQAAMNNQQQQQMMMAAMQQQQQQHLANHQRHAAYSGGRPVMPGPVDHMLQSQPAMQGGRTAMGHTGMLPGQGMMPPYGGYPAASYCGGCRREVQDYGQAIMCGSGCSLWFHVPCSGLTDFAYQLLVKEASAEWACDPCYKQKGQLVKPRMSHS